MWSSLLSFLRSPGSPREPHLAQVVADHGEVPPPTFRQLRLYGTTVAIPMLGFGRGERDSARRYYSIFSDVQPF